MEPYLEFDACFDHKKTKKPGKIKEKTYICVFFEYLILVKKNP